MATTTDAERRSLGITRAPYAPHDCSLRQSTFLGLDGLALEAFFGGAAGGGKSDALLMGSLLYVDVPGYSALILRKTLTALRMPGGLLERAHQWLRGSPAVWHGLERCFTWPSGATLTFGYLEHVTDRALYEGSHYHRISFDEVPQFALSDYRYLFSRLRRPRDGPASLIPLAMRAAGNPIGPGLGWVRERFIDPGDARRPVVRSFLRDNPGLDAEAYIRSLAELDPVTRRRLLEGDWEARELGGYFDRTWFEVVDHVPLGARTVRFWDLAATEATSASPDPDWTAAARLSLTTEGELYVEDVIRARKRPGEIERLIRQTAELDGVRCQVAIEQEPGSAGEHLLAHYRRRVLQGYAIRGWRPTGDKLTRAKPLSARAEAGDVKLVRGAWLPAFLEECEAFPEGDHDDQVDALAGAYAVLTERPGPRISGVG